jgi:hypothetical protein
MTLFAKLLSDSAVAPEAGRLYSSEDAPASSRSIRTGVSIKTPPDMCAVVHSSRKGVLDSPCVVESGVEIVLSKGPHEIAAGQHVGNLVFTPVDVAIEGDASEMGPLA